MTSPRTRYSQILLTPCLASPFLLTSPTEIVWKHPTNGATLYVGNQSAAQSRELLESKGITRIVNCTDNIPNFFEGKRSSPDGKRTKSAHSKTKKDDSVGVITYLRFAISFWSRSVKDNDASVIRYLTPLFEFVDESLANGQSVMVHCLAGAHRAGTTGVVSVHAKRDDVDVMTGCWSASKLYETKAWHGESSALREPGNI